MNEKELQVSEVESGEGTKLTSLASSVSKKQLQAAVEKEKASRAIIKQFVQDQLVEGTDFGTISATTKSGREFKSKATLFKPGQEKIFSLFGLVGELERDVETLEMLGNKPGLVAYKCIVFRNGKKIAEGRGAATVGENGRDANATIKIAEKRARMDACLSLGFSEFFTQDLEDPEYQHHAGTAQPAENTNPWTDKQRKYIFQLLQDRGLTDAEMREVICVEGGVTDPKDMTVHKASTMIERITGGLVDFKKYDQPTEPEVVEPEEPEEAEVVEPPIPEPDQLEIAAEVNLKFEELKYTQQERMRLYQKLFKSPLQPTTLEQWEAVSKELDTIAYEQLENWQ